MRVLLVIAVIILVMIGLGWITFQNDGDSTDVKFETQQMKDDTGKAIEEGKELFRRAEDRTEEAVEELDNDNEPVPDVNAPRSR